ncbi:MAG TPA: hypothetical protein VEZ90_03360, partial [Blastocatellia bacterium]|nr:hypothetical protein [Blastocatellia bacterium]
MQGHLKSEVVTVCFILALAAGGTGSLKSIVLAQQPGTSPPAAPASTGAGPAASATPAPAASAGPANPSPSPLGSTNGTPALSGVAISPSEVDFGEQPLSCQIARNIAITAGKDGAKLTFVSTNGDFAPSPVNCQLAPGETCAVTITFAPKHPGHTSGQLTSIKDANSSARFVLLSGVGVLSASSAPGPLGINGWWISFLAVLILVGLYLAALILVRWNMVARPARRLLLVQVEGVRGELNSLELTSPAGQIAAKQNQALLAKAAEQAPEHARVRLLDLLFWNRGQEIAGWSYVHEAEQL